MKRLKLGIITGAILGIFCIIGVSLRLGFVGNELFILATYINRVIMGIIIGLLPNKTKNPILRGALFGTLISGNLYLATNFLDLPGTIAGIVYGIIIDYIATKYSK